MAKGKLLCTVPQNRVIFLKRYPKYNASGLLQGAIDDAMRKEGLDPDTYEGGESA